MDSSWRKSSRSTQNGSCVECRQVDQVEVRDTKDRQGATLRFEDENWMTFVSEIKLGVFDLA